MNKLTNYQIDLIKRAKEKVSTFKSRSNHIILQVHTHIQSLQATGIGQEVLEHYVKTNNKKLTRVYYYEGKVYDFTNLETDRYSCINRHKEWVKVSKFHPGKVYRKFL